MPEYWEPPEAGVGGPEPLTPEPSDEPRTDLELTEGVKAALFLDPELSEAAFEVSTQDGIVTLGGYAATEQGRQRALELARGVQGVADVRDRITVR